VTYDLHLTLSSQIFVPFFMALKSDATSRDFLWRRPKQQFQDPQLPVQRLPRQPQQQSHQLMARQTKMLLLLGSLKWQAWHIGTSQTLPKKETDNKVLGCCPIKKVLGCCEDLCSCIEMRKFS
jgi:hypothetical protein